MTVSDIFLKKEKLINAANFNKAVKTNSKVYSLEKKIKNGMRVEMTLHCTTQDIQRDVKYYVSTEVWWE